MLFCIGHDSGPIMPSLAGRINMLCHATALQEAQPRGWMYARLAV